MVPFWASTVPRLLSAALIVPAPADRVPGGLGEHAAVARIEFGATPPHSSEITLPVPESVWLPLKVKEVPQLLLGFTTIVPLSVIPLVTVSVLPPKY